MSRTPRVSVVIPAYNAAGFLAATLQAVAAQIYRDFEVIVVDDGSKDDTARVAESFLKEKGLDGRCIMQPNKKIAGARNTGVAAARGEFIAFLDHDDLWFPEKLALVMREFDLHPEADLVCHHEEIIEKGKVVSVTRNGPAEEKMYERLLFRGNALSPSAVVVRKAKILEVGGFREDEKFNTVEDYDLWMRLAQICRFHFLDKVLGQYQLVERRASAAMVYHHSHLEYLLQDHFARYAGKGICVALKKKRRLASVYRAAARGLMSQGDKKGAAPYVRRALFGFPFDWKNPATAVLWLMR